jgi:Ferritin-like domain
MSEHTFSPAWRAQPLGRRNFLRVSAASAATVALVATTGCSTETPTPVAADPNQLVLPPGDPGLFYYGYLLALALSTTYDKVVASPPTDLTATERTVISNMRDHQVIYRELLRYYIDPTGSVVLFPANFAFNMATFTLTTRAGVLAAVQQLADLAVAAYPVLLPLLTSSSYQRVLLQKALSVQARHAATIRDLRTPGSFADATVVESATGLLRTKTPTEVTAALAPYFAPYVISVVNLAVPS